VKKHFELWSISFNEREEHFVAQPAQWISYSAKSRRVVMRRRSDLAETLPIGRIAFAGDQAKNAYELLCERLTETERSDSLPSKFDMEPFKVVRDMLREPSHAETIGGAPQIVKVYQYMRSAPIAVWWPERKSGRVFLQGRPVLDYERIDRWIIDPDTLISESPSYSRHDVDDAVPEMEADDDGSY